MDKTKIIFIHRNYSRFLNYTLMQAAYFNTDNVILLTDINYNNYNKKISIENLNNYQSIEIEEFDNCYIHMSTNNLEFEKFCWLRWFFLLNLMKQKNINSVLYVDSDVLLFCNILEILNNYSEYKLQCGLCIPNQTFDSFKWSASPHISYWTIDYIERFCNFIIASFQTIDFLKLYKEKWKWHILNNIPGGICDMTTLYFFWLNNKNSIINFLQIKDKKVFDNNINASANYNEDEFLVENGMKKVEFIKDYPHLILNNSRLPIRAFGLHFQGHAKKYIKNFSIFR